MLHRKHRTKQVTFYFVLFNELNIHCLSNNNHNIKKSVKQNTTLAGLYSNMSVNEQKLKRSISYDTNTVLSKSFAGQRKYCGMVKSCTNIIALNANISYDDKKRVKMTNIRKFFDRFVIKKNVQVINNILNIPEANNCQFAFVDYVLMEILKAIYLK